MKTFSVRSMRLLQVQKSNNMYMIPKPLHFVRQSLRSGHRSLATSSSLREGLDVSPKSTGNFRTVSHRTICRRPITQLAPPDLSSFAGTAQSSGSDRDWEIKMLYDGGDPWS